MATADAPHPQWNPLPRERTHERVIAEIEKRLKRGQLKVGDRLPPERLLAESLGVSRGSVREALRTLEAIGVIESGTGSGASAGSMLVHHGVAGLSMVLRLHTALASFSADDAMEVRDSLESLCFRKAVENASPVDVDDLRALVEKMHSATAVAECQALDQAFVRRIVAMAGNGLAAAVFSGLLHADGHGSSVKVDDVDELRRTQSLVDERAALLDAIATGDDSRGVQVMMAQPPVAEDASELSRWLQAG